MERCFFKAINFDLDTVRMKELGVYPYGYNEIREFFNHNGFIHRQGSGYVSIQKLNSMDIARLTKSMVNNIDWLANCVKKIDVTDIGKQHDLTKIVLEYSKKQKKNALMSTKPMLKQEDAKIIEHIYRSKLSNIFNTLYNKTKLTANEQDMLISTINFFTKGNNAQAVRIYKNSKACDDSRIINDKIIVKSNVNNSSKFSKSKDDKQLTR